MADPPKLRLVKPDPSNEYHGELREVSNELRERWHGRVAFHETVDPLVGNGIVLVAPQSLLYFPILWRFKSLCYLKSVF